MARGVQVSTTAIVTDASRSSLLADLPTSGGLLTLDRVRGTPKSSGATCPGVRDDATSALSCGTAPAAGYATRFDDLFGSLAQRRGFREYLAGLLAPRDRNKTPTALAGAEPVTGAQHPAVQRLRFFLSESR